MATKLPIKKQKADGDTPVTIIMEGVYYSLNPNGVTAIKPYELPVRFRLKDTESGACLALFSNELAQHLMPKAYPDFKRLKSYHIKDSLLPDGIDKPLSIMNRAELINFVEENDMGCYTDMYPDVEQLRFAIEEELKNPDVFLRNQAERRALYGEKIASASALLDLNGIDGITGPPPLVMASPNPVPTGDLVGIREDDDVTELPKPAAKGKGKKVDEALGF